MDAAHQIQIAATDDDITCCAPVMRQLRPHIEDVDFLLRVRQQQQSGYQLVFLSENGVCKAVAGFHFLENLANGRVLYVDDLSTDAASRSHGYGAALLHWLNDLACREGCNTLELDSGVQRFDAHRFYLRERMDIISHHFRLKLK